MFAIWWEVWFCKLDKKCGRDRVNRATVVKSAYKNHQRRSNWPISDAVVLSNWIVITEKKKEKKIHETKDAFVGLLIVIFRC